MTLPIEETAHPELEGLGKYEYGWADSDEAGASAKRGLSEEVVREHSRQLGDHFVETIWEIAGDVSPADFPLTDAPDL